MFALVSGLKWFIRTRIYCIQNLTIRRVNALIFVVRKT